MLSLVERDSGQIWTQQSYMGADHKKTQQKNKNTKTLQKLSLSGHKGILEWLVCGGNAIWLTKFSLVTRRFVARMAINLHALPGLSDPLDLTKAQILFAASTKLQGPAWIRMLKLQKSFGCICIFSHNYNCGFCTPTPYIRIGIPV